MRSKIVERSSSRTPDTVAAPGLDGIAVAETRLAHVDGEARRLEHESGKNEGETPPRLTLAPAAETAAGRLLAERHPDRPMAANVEFNTALLLDAIGLDRRLFSPTFAVARVAGWLAHVEEQRGSGRILRPRARYVGRMPASA